MKRDLVYYYLGDKKIKVYAVENLGTDGHRLSWFRLINGNIIGKSIPIDNCILRNKTLIDQALYLLISDHQSTYAYYAFAVKYGEFTIGNQHIKIPQRGDIKEKDISEDILAAKHEFNAQYKLFSKIQDVRKYLRNLSDGE